MYIDSNLDGLDRTFSCLVCLQFSILAVCYAFLLLFLLFAVLAVCRLPFAVGHIYSFGRLITLVCKTVWYIKVSLHTFIYDFHHYQSHQEAFFK